MLMESAQTRSEAERFACPTCSKSFVRKAHMLRHQQQHTQQKPFACLFCSKSFKRSDVLRAHQYRCKARGDAPVPEGQSKGRKRSSCESCVKLRTRCDSDTPCARCVELGKDCVRVHSTSNSEQPIKAQSIRPKGRDAIPIHHLLNSPPGDDFTDRFPIRDGPFSATLDDDSNSIADIEDASEASQWSEDPEIYDSYVGAPDTAFDHLFDGLESMVFNSESLRLDNVPVPHHALLNASPQAQALVTRSAEVRQALHATAAHFGGTYPECRHMSNLGPAIEQLTAAECDYLVSLYFECYHRHCPVIHRPSFQPALCPLPLFLSIMALGGMYAPASDVVHRMRSLMDVIECHIFSLPGLRDEFDARMDLSETPDDVTRWHHFEIFQGAYLIVIAQYFSGSIAAKRRARRQRFTRVLDIARSFKLPTAQHPSFVSISDEQTFAAWIRDETRVRQMNIMLAFDAAMAIFNNVPPRVSFSELDLELPCDSAYFEISSHSELLSRSMFPPQKMKLVDAFQKLFVASSDIDFTREAESFNCWDMLFLIHCLYTHVWRQTYANPLLRSSSSTVNAPSTIVDPLKAAIKNWKSLWDEIRSSLNREEIKNMGFETSADSYWTLTKLIVHRFEGKHSKANPLAAPAMAASATAAASPGFADVSNAIKGHPTMIKTESTTTGHPAFPGSYVSVGMGNTIPGAFLPSNGPEVYHGGERLTSAPAQQVPALYNSLPLNSVDDVNESSVTQSSQHKEALDFMPIETDFDSQGLHLRRILNRGR